MNTSLSSDLNVSDTALHHSPLLTLLLHRRGITTVDEANVFLSPSYDEHVHDPFLMQGMERAVERVLAAVDANEKIVIYSDFDADGIPGAVVLHDFFYEIGFTNFENYIPHRHDEGFGVHIDAIDQFQRDKVDLIITIDCGIADVEEVARARFHDIDVIITDHHEPNGKKPGALAVLDPKQPDCSYPFDGLCGAGVVFKLVQGMLQRRDFGIMSGREKWLLDMVGLATLSDMVPLVGENRVFAYYGLQVVRKSRRPGLQKMIRLLRMQQQRITEDDIGFMIAPRINAASRMGIPMDAFTFLATTDHAIADRTVKHLNRVNDERKGTVASMAKSIKQKIQHRNKNDGKVPDVIVAGDPDWKPSLLGLVANTLSDEYDRPVFLWGRDGRDVLKGSARSNGRVDIIKLMESAGDVLDAYGGHQQAGGFAISHEYIHQLEGRLIDALRDVGEELLNDTNDVIDTDLTLADVNDRVYDEIAMLAPFGVGNEKPTFRFRDVIIKEVRTFGKENNHLELTFHNERHTPIKAIGFFCSVRDFTVRICAGEPITLIATMERSYFRGRPELRLRIVDIHEN